MSRRSSIVASIAAGALGMSLAVACGDSEGGRENVERGNPGNTSQGPQEIETGPTTLGSTGDTQPTIDQNEQTP